MDKLKFSIIIPTYNSAKEVQIAINSVKEQTYKNYEIIVINDCSTDNTSEVLSKIDGIKVINNAENLKAGGSRNRGMAEANGEYILFLDADDYLAENTTLEKISNIIAEDTVDLIYLGFKVFGKAGIEEEWIPTEENSTFTERARNWRYENVWDVCWNREFLQNHNIKFVEKKYFEDFVFYYKGIMNAKTYKVASFPTHIYVRLKSDSMTNKITEQKLQDLYYNVNEFLEEAKKQDKQRKPDIIYAIYRVVEYSTRLLQAYKQQIAQANLKEELKNTYSDLIRKYQNIKLEKNNETSSENENVWLCWWQGVENAPEVVKKCIESIKRNCGGRKVVIITKENYKEYVTLPEYIEEKVANKTMSITHLSDVLRVNLLSKYGGLWLDATCFLTEDISDYLKSDFFSIRLPYNEKETCVSEGKWCVFCMYSKKNNILFNFMTDFFNEYWRKETTVKDYYLFDYAMTVAYENIEEVREMMDSLPQTNENIHELKGILNDIYDEVKYNELLKTNKIHKLAREKTYYNVTNEGKETFYGHIMK